MAIVAVRFGDQETGITLRWRVREHDVATRWLNLLRSAINHGIKENDRIYNIPNQKWDRDLICKELESCMRSIEVFHKNLFKTWPHPEMTNEDCNVLHIYFEKLRGSIDFPSSLYTRSPPSIRREITRYNTLIHRWESYVTRGPARFVCTFNITRPVPLQDEDYRLFSLEHGPGAMCLNYPLVGKQFLDMFRDQDDLVSPEAIRPMDRFSANFLVRFSPTDEEKAGRILNAFYPWFDARSEYFKSLGFELGSDKLALGYIQVADPIDEIDDEILHRIGEIDRIDSVNIEDDSVEN
jgi:hypothetical protein